MQVTTSLLKPPSNVADFDKDLRSIKSNDSAL